MGRPTPERIAEIRLAAHKNRNEMLPQVAEAFADLLAEIEAFRADCRVLAAECEAWRDSRVKWREYAGLPDFPLAATLYRLNDAMHAVNQADALSRHADAKGGA